MNAQQSTSQKQFTTNPQINLENFSSPVLERIAEQVRNKETSVYGAYDRTHNRHNR